MLGDCHCHVEGFCLCSKRGGDRGRSFTTRVMCRIQIYFGGAWLSVAREVIEKVLLTKMGVLEADSTVVF